MAVNAAVCLAQVYLILSPHNNFQDVLSLNWSICHGNKTLTIAFSAVVSYSVSFIHEDLG